MARTGRFGRQPRVAQSLTNTLVAIAREFQRQQDSNLMDAWQKGGMYEGRKATDELVLKHWKDRMAGVSKDDPLYDTYKNAHTQLDYSIHESKMTAAYALHKKSDGQMIAFYLGWAKKVPKDSEFYRVLQRDAGQYMRVARASGEAAARKAAEEHYQNLQAGTRKGKEAAGEFMIDTLRRVAQSGYADGGISALISEPGSNSDLTDFDPSDPEQMLRLLGVIKGEAVVFHDDDKKAVTGKDIQAQLAKLDPSFHAGALDVGYVTGLLDRQVLGLNERIDRATKTGHLTDAESLKKSKTYVAMLNREVGAWPVQKSYTDLRETFDAVANDPTASPAAVLKAHQEYVAGLTSLAESPNIAADDNMRSRLIGEAKGSDGMPTLAESFTGLQNGAFDPTSAKDSANTKAHMEFLQEQVDSVAKGAAFWTYGSTNSAGVFVPQAGGNEIGSALPDQIMAGGANMQAVTIADPRGGIPIKMLTTATPVFVTAKDEKGLALHPENANPVAYAYDIVKGGKTQTVYGFQTKDQGFMFSENPPWDESLHMRASSSGGNHLEVELAPPSGVDLSKDTDFGNGWHVQGAKATSPGSLTFDPLMAATSTSTRNSTGSADPTSDFHSLTLTALMGDTEGRSILNTLDKNPLFKQQLDDDAASYAGMQRDPKTGAWVPGTGDQNKLFAARQQVNIASSTSSFNQWVDESSKMWQRLSTGTPFAGGAQPTQPGGAFRSVDHETFAKLATDTLQGTPFEALGAAFHPGTNQIKQPSDRNETDGLAIKPVGTIRVPGIDSGLMGSLTSPTPVTGPVAGPTQVQAGSTAPTGMQPQQATQTGSTAPYSSARRYIQ